MKVLPIFILAIFFSVAVRAQSGFEFTAAKSKTVIPFEIINNLIFIPINVNGVELKLLLDTGVSETLLFSLEDKGEVSFNRIEKINLRGLGSAESVEALKSSGNVLSFPGLVDKSHDIYIILDQDFNFSAHIGIPVNGIIGYNFFKDHIVEINYESNKVIVHNENKRIRRRMDSKYVSMPISLELNKPYLNTVLTQVDSEIPAKLLIDTGSSDAVWLFKKPGKIELPKNNLEDFLGRGFSGEIHGHRGRIARLKVADFAFNNPIAAFPDSTSMRNINMVQDRAGSLGGEILKRFSIIFDYPNSTIHLRKGKDFDAAFQHNMSGIDIQHEGMQWVQETVAMKTIASDKDLFDAGGERILNNFRYKFELKPIYSLANVRSGSPAEASGLQKGDIVVLLNGKKAYKYTLQQITEMLKSEDGRLIQIQVERNTKKITAEFRLKSLL